MSLVNETFSKQSGSTSETTITHPKTFIIQEYIERPFLYNRRKFDIRCYVMLSSLVNFVIKVEF